MDLRYLAQLLEEERDRNPEFRDEVREKLAHVEKWIAVRDAIEDDRELRWDTRKKALSWTVGTIVAIAGVLVPVLLSR